MYGLHVTGHRLTPARRVYQLKIKTVILDGFIADGCKDGRQALRSEARGAVSTQARGRRATKAEGALHR